MTDLINILSIGNQIIQDQKKIIILNKKLPDQAKNFKIFNLNTCLKLIVQMNKKMKSSIKKLCMMLKKTQLVVHPPGKKVLQKVLQKQIKQLENIKRIMENLDKLKNNQIILKDKKKLFKIRKLWHLGFKQEGIKVHL